MSVGPAQETKAEQSLQSEPSRRISDRCAHWTP